MATGTRSYAVYGWESTFKTEATTKDKVFGVSDRISTLSFDNEVDELFALGKQVAVELQEKGFSGSWGVDSYLSNGDVFQTVMETVTTTNNNDGTYTHTLTLTNSKAKSMTIEVGSRGFSEDVVQKLLGCVTTSLSISASAKNLVSLRLSGVYADEVLGTTFGSAIVEQEKPFTFAHSDVLLNNTSIGYIDSVDITINTNAELLWALNDRIAVNWVTKNYSITGSFSMYLDKADFVKYGLGGNLTATRVQQAIEDLLSFDIVFNNKKAVPDIREIKIHIPAIKVRSLNFSGLEPEGLVKISVDWAAKETQTDSFKIDVTNDQATLK